VIDSPWGRLGTMVCFDIHNEAKIMRGLKVDTLLYCVAWVEEADSLWFQKELPSIARENHLNIIAANWTVAPDSKPKWHGFAKARLSTHREKSFRRREIIWRTTSSLVICRSPRLKSNLPQDENQKFPHWKPGPAESYIRRSSPRFPVGKFF